MDPPPPDPTERAWDEGSIVELVLVPAPETASKRVSAAELDFAVKRVIAAR